MTRGQRSPIPANRAGLPARGPAVGGPVPPSVGRADPEQSAAAGVCPVSHRTQTADGAPGSLLEGPESRIREALADLVAEVDYPCVGAKSVFNRNRAPVTVYDQLADPGATPSLYQDLARFAADHPREDPETGTRPQLASFLAAFRGPIPASEVEFEELLWRQLALLHGLDDVEWDEHVSSDPADPRFGFSVAGRAFFVIGMHPAASRAARRTPLPVLVFNLHDQFEQLRVTGGYERLRDTVRRRDARLQGDLNPMVADHGSRSEARQYAGREVPDDWQPPHDPRTTPEGPQ